MSEYVVICDGEIVQMIWGAETAEAAYAKKVEEGFMYVRCGAPLSDRPAAEQRL